MKPEWVNMRPIPTPIPELRIEVDKPFAEFSFKLAHCAWGNPSAMYLLGEDAEASTDVVELTKLIEAALNDGTVETWDGAIAVLTICENT